MLYEVITEEIRAEIDHIDQQIISLLAERLEYVKAIVKFKKTADDVVAQKRFDAVIATRRQLAAAKGLNPDVIETIYRTWLGYCIEEEHKLIED